MSADEARLRTELLAAVRKFGELSAGCSGNASVRLADGFLITPSGKRCADLLQSELVRCDQHGQRMHGALAASSEWRLHQTIYAANMATNAVVHVHSPYATAIACTRQGIPAFHYMVAIAGGTDIRCAHYATFGTQALADHALEALQGRHACLLANHGMIALGKDAATALGMAQEVETLARQYWLSRQHGEPVILDAEEMRINLEKFRYYGTRRD